MLPSTSHGNGSIRARRHLAFENHSRSNQDSGFSVIELAITTTIMMIIAAIAIPNLMRAMNSYRLTNTARNVSDLIQRARYEAIKQNTKITCNFSLGSAPPAAWVDVNRTGTFAGNDPKFVYPTPVLATASSIPSTSSLGYPSVTQVSNSGSITFDSRGAVDYTGAPGGITAWVLYFSLNGDTSYGAKAVTVEPLGRSKVWTAAPGSNAWQNP